MKAHDTFRMWHQKDPRKEIPVSGVKLLDELDFGCIGRATEIKYTSDKWEIDGDFFPYVHDHASRPGVYVPLSKTSPEEQIGRTRSTLSLLGLRKQPRTLEVAQLGTVDELTFIDADGEEQVQAYGRQALLLSTPDRKGVLILAGKRPIIVRGGEMRVTSRGIVK